MISPWYCPRCGLRLREVQTSQGVDENRYYCKNSHAWQVRSSGTIFNKGTDHLVITEE